MKELTLPPTIKIVESVKCQGIPHLLEHLEQIVLQGGEGVICREPEGPYIEGRSWSMLKVKVSLYNFNFRNLKTVK